MATYWFFNSDRPARTDVATTDLWLESGVACSGGTFEKFAAPLGELSPGDVLLLYHNGVGVVAIGRVLEQWDRVTHTSGRVVYQSEPEYRIRVDWYVDLRSNPIDRRRIVPYQPRGLLQRVKAYEADVHRFVGEIEQTREVRLADEASPEGLREGATRTMAVDARERNPVARSWCIAHWGCRCIVCGFDFRRTYGLIGESYIHVHHLDPLAAADGERHVDPVDHLRPVCPNCHAMLHKKSPPYSPEELETFMRQAE